MILKKYHSYIFSQFTKIFLFVSLIFFCIIVIINIFEEIRFHEKYNTDTQLIIYLSFLNAPSVMFEIFPFIFLITIKFFYLKFSEQNELEIFSTNGVSKLKIIYILSLFSLFLGIILLLLYYSFSSELKNQYLDIKNRFSNTNEYLAVVNDDGLWIKEEIDENIFIIHAEKFDKDKLKFLTITETDKYYNNKNTINADEAIIISKNWQLSNVNILDNKGINKNYKSYVYNSTFTGEIISNLFSNLNSLNIYELHKLSNSYLKIGYSNTDIKIHLNKIYSMPIFYILMTILGFIIINKFKRIKSKFFTIIFGIFVSVLVYYLNYFASLLGNKGILPIHLSVWMPLLLLFLLCNIGLLRVNEN